MKNILKKIHFLRSVSIEEIVNDKNNYKFANDNYNKAYSIYKSKINDSEFIRSEPNFIRNEKIKLGKIIESKTFELNYTSGIITLFALGITIIASSLIKVSIPGSRLYNMIYNFLNRIAIGYNNENNIQIISVFIQVISFIAIVTLSIIIYDKIKNKHIVEIFNARICLEVLEDIEKERKNKLEETIKKLNEALVNSNNAFDIANKSIEIASKKIEEIKCVDLGR